MGIQYVRDEDCSGGTRSNHGHASRLHGVRNEDWDAGGVECGIRSGSIGIGMTLESFKGSMGIGEHNM